MLHTLPMYLQHEKTECGHACIAMVASFFGHELNVQDVRNLTAYSQAGMTLFQMREICTYIHLNAQALRIELHDLEHLSCPAILHWELDHFVVVKKVTSKRIWIHDPAIGIRICTWDEVSRSFTGVVLLVEKAKTFEAIHSKGKLKLWDFVREAKGWFRAMSFLLGISFVVESAFLLQPLFVQYVTDSVVGANDWENVYTIAAILIVLLIFIVALDYLKGRTVLWISNQLQAQWSLNTMRHLLKMPLTFFEKRHKGDIQLSFQGVEEIQRKMGVDLLHVLLDGVLFLVNGIVMFIYSSFLSMWVFIGVVLMMGLRYISYHILYTHRQLALNQRGKAMSIFIETLQGMLAIKSFIKEQSRFSLWRNAYIHTLNAELVISKMQLWYQSAQHLITHAELIMLVCLGAKLIFKHQFSLGMLVAFLSYRLVFVNKAASLIGHFFDYRLLNVQLERVQDIFLEKPEVYTQKSIVVKPIQGSLQIKSLCFVYDVHQKPVFEALNFEVARGEKLAIVGPSGCGKTTLLKVLMGLFLPTSGEILCDGMPLAHIGLTQYRKQVAAVMQEDMLLSGSIQDNITFFEEQIDLEYMEEVAKISAIHETIMSLPMGYATKLGEMGSLLSGGQKQRLLLARALYKRPNILFLDEASSHLDSATEREINLALKQLAITQVIVAHRQETIVMADRVLELI